MRIAFRLCCALMLAALAAAAIILYYLAWPNLPAYTAPAQVQYLPQWTEADRQTYYFTPQGTQVKGLRYQWFTALEQPFSATPFAVQANLGRFGFLFDDRPTAANPGHLPVGFTQHLNPADGQRYLDITCAACHTGELRYQGTALRIDGGTAQHVLPSTVPTLRGGSFGQALVASLAATAYVPWKFDRFARRVLGDAYPHGKAALHDQLRASLFAFLRAAWNDTHRNLYPVEEGPGRTDAFGRIANAAFGDGLTASNYHPGNAPVDYPHLWDIWTFDWVQWNGSARQPMARNIGESLGVGATLQYWDASGQPLAGGDRYPSSVRVTDLYLIEQTLQRLAPPAWPQTVLGAVNLPLASQGRALFVEQCASCHVPPTHMSDGRPEQALAMIPAQTIGTDPTAADNIADHRFDLSALQWTPADLDALNVYPKPAQLDLHSVSVAMGLSWVTAFVERRAYADAGITAEQQGEMNGFDLDIGVREQRGYKARPLAGIWATPPFLHNGSVPTLYQLLSPQDERDTTFYRGTFDYDPRHLGYQTGPFAGGFLYDTRLTGNRNSGHEFRDGPRGAGVIGRLLQPQERWALLEYLKVLGGPLEHQLP
jgi:mono/diheme cytochrome c family protein